MKKSIIIGAFFVFCLAGASAGAGTIIFLDGDVTIQRDNKTIPSSQIDIGTVVENFDLISTGKNSSVQIELNAKTGVKGTIDLSAKSVFQLELSDLKSSQVAGLELMAGNIGVKVNKMLGGSGLEVRTGSAVMGVRGTEFKVMTTPGGDLLVTTREGKVQCADENNTSIYSMPGTVVENVAEEGLRSKALSVASLSGFESSWQSERIEAIRANAPKAIKNFANRYEQLVAQFNRAYDRMSKEALPIIIKWTNETSKNTMASRIDVLKEKKVVISHLMALKKTSYILERIYYRLSDLQEFVENGSTNGEIRRGYTYTDFYKQFDLDKINLKNKLSYVRYIMKLYALRNEGSVPIDMGGSGVSDDAGDFFN